MPFRKRVRAGTSAHIWFEGSCRHSGNVRNVCVRTHRPGAPGKLRPPPQLAGSSNALTLPGRENTICIIHDESHSIHAKRHTLRARSTIMRRQKRGGGGYCLVVAEGARLEAGRAVDEVVLPRPYEPLVETQLEDFPGKQ